MRWVLALWLACVALPVAAATLEPNGVVGRSIDLATPLLDEAGKTQPLGTILAGRPGVVLFGYDNCPNLCGVAQQLTATNLGRTGLEPGGYVPVFISLAPEEGPGDAVAAKAALAAAIGEDASRWHFVTGTETVALAASVGIDASEREAIRNFEHPVATFVLTADGRVSSVLPGLDVTPAELRLALVDASAGKLGNLLDHALLLCAGYDASTGRYTPLVIAGLRIGALATLVAALSAIGFIEMRRRRWTR